jgi:hypothetical protein
VFLAHKNPGPSNDICCPIWHYAADAHLLKLQRLHNIVLRATISDSRTPVRKLHVAFIKIPYVYR